ncbi:glycine N-acyltransferase-like protein 3 isoform X2 [Branchiostoma floridae]|uniref:Glycine N-acyltransferase-like protein n=1 Tax=Branchiostoma floridae TaxID=7739 RepID=A0A9J7LII1_BRAFL|nr:glycine N-acyltransferase-like protein 3 isoform X2 [Branchiostoma floridae]
MTRSLLRSELRQLLFYTAQHYLDGKIPWEMTFEVDRWPDYTAVLWTGNNDASAPSFAKKALFLHWTSENGLRQLLKLTSMKWTSPLLLIAFPLSGLSILKEHLELQGVPFPEFSFCDTAYYLHKTCPTVEKVKMTDNKVSITPLKPEHSQLVSRTWKFGGTSEVEERIHYQISTFPSACVYDQDGNPVSWIMFNYYGSQGAGYTLPEHRGKGYFQLASKYLISICLQKGYLPFLFIEHDNEHSRVVHRKLGYSWVEAGRCAYIHLNRKKSSG